MNTAGKSIKAQLKNDFSLVLSGGGALGIAHLNVLRYLDENGFKPSEILGVSMGAIISAAYALHYNEKDIYHSCQNRESTIFEL